MLNRKHFLFELVKLNKKSGIFILMASITSSLLNGVGLVLLIPVIFYTFDIKLAGAGASISPKLTNFLFYLVPIDPRITLFVATILILLIKNAMIVLRIKLVTRYVTEHLLRLREQVTMNVLDKDITFFLKEGTGRISSYIIQNTEKCSKLASDSIELTGMAFQLLVYGVMLCKLSPELMVLTAVFIGPVYIMLRRLTVNSRRFGAALSEHGSRLSQSVSNMLQGIRFVKLGNRERDHVGVVLKLSREGQLNEAKLMLAASIHQPTTEAAALGLLCAMVGLIYYEKQSGHALTVTPDKFFSFLIVISRALPLFSIVASKRLDIAGKIGALASIEHLLESREHSKVSRGTKNWSSTFKQLSIEDLSFSFPNSERNVLNNIDIKIKAGESVAIVGPSGSGKSTLIDLILRFYEPTSGKICIDGLDTRDLILENYRHHIGLVPQEPLLFFSSIRDNLTYLRPNATEAEIWRVLEQADLAEFISALPTKLETQVGERGVLLSGGQRQRMCIARTLLMNPDILIFDEATSSLDSLTESKIVESIRKVSRNRTSITIAHRLATILHCDRIFFIEQGWLVESGTVNELLTKNSRFKKFAEAQNIAKLVA